MSIIDDTKQTLSDLNTEYQGMLADYLDPDFSGDRDELLSEMAEVNSRIEILQNIITYLG